jgi:eukaryotic-like serine/threonine-protein kinase
LNGKEVDSRSDLFSFGCVFYEMLSGRRAFEASSVAGVIAALLTAEAPPLAGAEVPPALDRLLRRCLNKDPEERWQNARDVMFALAEVGAASERQGLPGSAQRRRPEAS